MDKNKCTSCGGAKCSCKNKEFTKAVIEINNPEQITLMRRVVVPASMGDDTTVPPTIGKYHNVLLYYEANSKSYLYSSDGIPTQLVNGVTDYEQAVNLPQINGVTLLGDKSAADLELADAPMVITVADGNTSWSGADTAEDVYDFFLNKGKVNIIFNEEENYSYEIASAAYIPGEEKMMCTLAVATIAGGETSEFEGNALFGTMTLYTADKAIDVSQIELQPKLFVTDFTGLDLNYNELSGLPATNYSIGMVKPGNGLEVASDGTLSVSEIEQYAHFFNTVTDMKAADLADGEFARTLGFYTVNDGGSALYKIRESTVGETIDEKFVIAIGSSGLVAELITDDKVNIFQVGGQQNFGSVCNYVIGKHKSIYVPDMPVECSETIILDQNELQFVCDAPVTFTATNSTFFRLAGEYNIIRFNNTITVGTTNVFMELGSNSVIVRNNELYINKVLDSRIGLLFNPDYTHGVQYLKCSFNRIYSTEAGILMQPGDHGANWVSASTFFGGCLHGPYGIITRKGAEQTDPFNDLCFDRVSFNGHIQLPLDLQFLRNNWFNKLRMSENLEGTYDIKMDDCRCTYISNEARLRLPRIQCINCTDPQSHNVIEAPQINDSDTYAIGDRLEFVENEPYVPTPHLWQMRENNLYCYSDTETTFNVPEYYFDNMVVTIGAPSDGVDLTYFLPKVFNEQVKRFYLQVKNKNATTALRLRTQNNQTVIYFDGTSNTTIANKVYICERSSETSHSPNLHRWQIHEITPIISV